MLGIYKAGTSIYAMEKCRVWCYRGPVGFNNPCDAVVVTLQYV